MPVSALSPLETLCSGTTCQESSLHCHTFIMFAVDVLLLGSFLTQGLPRVGLQQLPVSIVIMLKALLPHMRVQQGYYGACPYLLLQPQGGILGQ